MPLYSQLARLLEQQINANVYPLGARLPTEADLAAKHGVSAITVRSALKVLTEKGRVERFPGKGTFVLEKPPICAAWGLGTLADIDLTTTQSEMTTLSSAVVSPPAWVLEAFAQGSQAQVHWMRNVRAVQAERFLVSDVYHRPDLTAVVSSQRFRKLVRKRKLVVMALCELTGISLGEIRQSLSVTLANTDIAQALQIAVNEPLLVMERVFVAGDGRVIQVGKSHYRADHFRYNLNLRLIEERGSVSASARRRVLDGTNG